MSVPVRIAKLSSQQPDFQAVLARLLRFDAAQDEAISATVKQVIADIRARGDQALLELTQKFDQLSVGAVSDLEITPQELRQAFDHLPEAQRRALSEAAQRIREFHELQRQSSWTHTDGIGNRLGQRVSALDRAGLYVPGGKAAYPSSVLMNAIPAKVAGVSEVIMVVPTPGGVRNPLVLAAAFLG
ncbi:MAG: histidinol dehydrogenase, partial [Burkholderiaceae bacterium]